MDDPATFEQLVQFRAPASLSKAIDRAASQRSQSKSDYIRQALVDRLQADGGSTVGEQQYCLVKDGELVTGPRGKLVTTFKLIPINENTIFEGVPTDALWLPIENEDTELFDPEKHYRMKHLPLRLDGDRVVRTFPIVSKERA